MTRIREEQLDNQIAYKNKPNVFTQIQEINRNGELEDCTLLFYNTFATVNQRWSCGLETGGGGIFAVRDDTNNKLIFYIEKNAPDNSLVIDNEGNIGFGTNVFSPTEKFKIKEGSTDLFTMYSNGLLQSKISNYDSLVANDQDFVTKKWVVEHHSDNSYWKRELNTIKTETFGDDLEINGLIKVEKNFLGGDCFYFSENTAYPVKWAFGLKAGGSNDFIIRNDLAPHNVCTFHPNAANAFNINLNGFIGFGTGVFTATSKIRIFDGATDLFLMSTSGLMTSQISNYDSIVTNDQDFVTKKWVENVTFLNRISGTLSPKTLNDKFGIGVSTTSANLQVHESASATSAFVQITNDATTSASGKGLTLGVFATTGDGIIQSEKELTFNVDGSLNGTISGTSLTWNYPINVDNINEKTLNAGVTIETDFNFETTAAESKFITERTGLADIITHEMKIPASGTGFHLYTTTGGASGQIRCAANSLGIGRAGDEFTSNEIFVMDTSNRGITRTKRTSITLNSVGSPYNSINASLYNIIYCDTSAGDVTINGFSSGAINQDGITIVFTDTTNNLIINNNNASGTQKILTSTRANETYSTGGQTTAVYNGTNWYTGKMQ